MAVKKYVGKVLALILAVCAIGWLIYRDSQKMVWLDAGEERPALDGVSFQLDSETYSKKHFIITYHIVNEAENDLFGSPPETNVRVEQWTEAGWRYRGANPELSSRRGNKVYTPNALGFLLFSGQSSEEYTLSLQAHLPRLDTGRYRLVWDFETGQGDTLQNYRVCQEFTIE